MIRKLMASSALLALVSAGAISVAHAEDVATKPAVVAAATTNEAAASDKKLVPDSPTLATAFIGRSVYSSVDPESDNIGDVNDLIIGDDGSITDAIVGVGGFLGIGEKNVAVPFDKLQVVERDGEIRLIYAATREDLDAAPAVDMASYDPASRFAEKQAAMNAAEQPDANAPLAPAPAAADNMAAAPADQQMAATDSADNMAAPAMDVEAGFVSAGTGQIRASTLIGKSVYGADDESIGEVSDLVLQKEGGTRAALIDVGGFLGVGEKTVAIPFDELKFSQADEAAGQKVTVAMSKEQLEALPDYEAMDQTASAPMPADQNMAPAADGTAPAMAPATDDQTAATDQKPNPDRITTGALGTGTAMTFEPQQVSASELMGARVYGADDSDLGEVSDIVFDEKGEINAVVVDVGGFLGIGEKPVALDFSRLNLTADQGGNLIVSVNATQEQLDKAPTYEVTMK